MTTNWDEEEAVIEDDLAECETILEEVWVKEEASFKNFLDGLKKRIEREI